METAAPRFGSNTSLSLGGFSTPTCKKDAGSSLNHKQVPTMIFRLASHAVEINWDFSALLWHSLPSLDGLRAEQPRLPGAAALRTQHSGCMSFASTN